MVDLTWKTLNFHNNEFSEFNIFSHSSFKKDFITAAHEFSDPEQFLSRIKNLLRYCFWAKSEYEVIVSSWPPGKNEKGIKLDVYFQVMLNWENFADYILKKQEEILKDKIKTTVVLEIEASSVEEVTEWVEGLFEELPSSMLIVGAEIHEGENEGLD